MRTKELLEFQLNKLVLEAFQYENRLSVFTVLYKMELDATVKTELTHGSVDMWLYRQEIDLHQSG